MKNIIRFIVSLVVAVFMVVATPAVAQVAAPDEIWEAGGYCLDEVSALILTKAIVERGAQGYREVIRSPGVRCYDSDILVNASPVRVTTLEKQWPVVSFEGQKMDFWTVKDKNGRTGWVWFLVDDGV